MPRRPLPEPVVSAEAITHHPAARAWAAVHPGAVTRIDSLAMEHHCRVYRLETPFAPMRSVIAKWGDREFHFAIDTRFQKDILPSAGLPALEIYGELVDRREPSFWMFVEDAGDEVPVACPENRRLMAQWLARLNGWTGFSGAAETFRDCGPDRYRAHLTGARQRIAANISQPWFTDANRRALEDLVRRLEELDQHWDDVEALCAAAPRGLVHGDLAGKNIRRREGPNGPELLVFDWQTAGIGPPCVDLAPAIHSSLVPDLECYERDARSVWPTVSREYLDGLVAIGKVFRVVAAVDWESYSLANPRCCAQDLLMYAPLLTEAAAGFSDLVGNANA